MYCINEALTVLSWHENLPKDEIPPRHLWWSGERVDAWFRKVKEARDKKYGGGNKSTYAQAEDSAMTSNQLVNRDELIPGGDGGTRLPL